MFMKMKNLLNYRLLPKIKSLFLVMRYNGISKIIGSYTYFGDGIVTSNFLPWTSDRVLATLFEKSLDDLPKSEKRQKVQIWRAHIVSFCANSVRNTPGDFIELGVNYGVLSFVVASQSELLENRNFYLVDAFGMPGFKMSGEYKKTSYQDDIYDTVVQRFRFEPKVKVIRGLIPNILNEIPTEEIAFLMIDLNDGIPERQALELFWSKINSGGIIYFDDYGQNFPEVKRNIDLFLEDKQETLLVFPTGQSILIKS